MITNFQKSKSSKGDNSKKNKKFEAPRCYSFRDIMITNFSKSKSAKGDNSKKIE